jgi:uncharacterized protein (DUF1499 family)
MAYLSPFLLIFVILAYSGNGIVDAGIAEGKLPPCPATPNCVSSQSEEKGHATPPLHYQGEMGDARQRLLEVIKAQKRARIVSIQGNYIHAEFTSALFRFVDDVEFLFDDTAKVIHVRSASRVGSYDLGVNRRRIEDLRSRFEKTKWAIP